MTRRSAESIHEMWHQKHPWTAKHRSYEFDRNGTGCVSPVGRAVEILYTSDKWEKNGDFWPYEHDFDSRPTVYTYWGPGQGTRVSSLLGVQDINSSWEMAILAYVKSVTVDVDGEHHRMSFAGKGPVMTCSSDLKTVVILAKGGPIFVRGGKMVVTERGIVK